MCCYEKKTSRGQPSSLALPSLPWAIFCGGCASCLMTHYWCARLRVWRQRSVHWSCSHVFVRYWLTWRKCWNHAQNSVLIAPHACFVSWPQTTPRRRWCQSWSKRCALKRPMWFWTFWRPLMSPTVIWSRAVWIWRSTALMRYPRAFTKCWSGVIPSVVCCPLKALMPTALI